MFLVGLFFSTPVQLMFLVGLFFSRPVQLMFLVVFFFEASSIDVFSFFFRGQFS